MTLPAHKAALLIRAQAETAKVEAMKAENQSRTQRGLSLAYTEAAFMECANTLEHLAREMVEYP